MLIIWLEKKYFIIRNNLRVRDYADVPDQEKGSDKIWKVAPLINAVRAGCLSNPCDKQVSMNKQMITFWGHAATRKFVRGKPNPCGLKNFVVCPSDGLPLDFFLYEGKGDSVLPNNELNYPKLDIGGKVIVRLTQNLPKGISILMDRYFTSIDLLDELHLRGFPGTGTLQKDRIPACAPLYSDAELREGGRGYFCQVVREDGQMCIIKWFDNKPVILASTIHDANPTDVCKRWSKKEKSYINVVRPNVIKTYHSAMGDVDMLDRMISYYRISARTRKWAMRLIFHMIDFAAAASCIERRRMDAAEGTQRRDRFDFLDLRIDLAYHLLSKETVQDEEAVDDDDGPPAPKRKVPMPSDNLRTSRMSQHLPERPENWKPSRCRLPGCDSPKGRIRYSTCKVCLCLNANRNCFKLFHEL